MRGEGYRDYIYNIIHNGNERRINTQNFETAVRIGKFIISIIYEPADWVFTGADCFEGDCSPLTLLGLFPLIPGSVIDDVTSSAVGGVYKLVNPSGQVVRVGHTKNLASRMSKYRNHPDFFDLEFQVEYYTNNYATRRGLEQGIFDKYKPPLNKNNPISPTNKNSVNYRIAAYNFLLELLGMQ
jgi:hypothetical protein